MADRNADSTSNRSLAITNTGGKLDAGSTSIDAAALGGDGQVLSQQATTVKLSGDFSNSGTVRSNGSIDIDSAGTLNNDGLMQASTLLKIKARTIMNGATGTLVGTGLQLKANDAHTLVNRGLIDGQETVIVTQALRNLGTGRMVARLTRTHEASMPKPWRMSDGPTDYIDGLLKAIVGIEIDITSLVGKIKLSQNKDVRDMRNVGKVLAERGSQILSEATLRAADEREKS